MEWTSGAEFASWCEEQEETRMRALVLAISLLLAAAPASRSP
jgi:hypothetical protein